MSYTEAKEKYTALGRDVEAVRETPKKAPLSLHCWMGDVVRGFNTASATMRDQSLLD